MFEYLLVLFPQARPVLLNGEVMGETNVVIEVQGGEYEVSLVPPLDFTPPSRLVDLRNTSLGQPLTIKFEEA